MFGWYAILCAALYVHCVSSLNLQFCCCCSNVMFGKTILLQYDEQSHLIWDLSSVIDFSISHFSYQKLVYIVCMRSRVEWFSIIFIQYHHPPHPSSRYIRLHSTNIPDIHLLFDLSTFNFPPHSLSPSLQESSTSSHVSCSIVKNDEDTTTWVWRWLKRMKEWEREREKRSRICCRHTIIYRRTWPVRLTQYIAQLSFRPASKRDRAVHMREAAENLIKKSSR